MSYGVQSASLFGSSSQTGSSTSLLQFANLDLTEEQREQIRSIFKTAKSEGLSDAEIQQQISAILTTTQQTAYQADVAAQNSSQSTQSSQSSQSAPPQQPPGGPGGNPFTDPNGPFANLDLTSTQQTQIASILKNGQAQGLSFDQINAQISAILTTSQQATFATDIQNLPPPPGSQNGSSTLGNLLSNLNLSSSQQSQINTILQNASSDGLSQSDVLTQIETVLTPAQQSALLQDVQTAQAYVSGQRQSGSGGTTATLSNGVSETDIQNQIAAATSLILQQFQSNVTTSA